MKVSTPQDEAEPCLRNNIQHSPNNDSSVVSAFSSVSHRRPDYARRCIIVLLIHAVFILAVFFAFYIGHWISEQHVKNETFAELFPPKTLTHVTPTSGHRVRSHHHTTTNHHRDNSPSANEHRTTIKIPETHARYAADDSNKQHLSTNRIPFTRTSVTSRSSSTTVSTTITTTTVTPTVMEKLIPLVTVKNFTLEDVHPPVFENFEFMEVLHAGMAPSKKKTLLIPLPTTILPIHYDLKFDFTQFSFKKLISGNATIHLQSYGNSTDEEIVFHSGPKLKLNRIRLRRDGKIVAISSVKHELSKKLTRLRLKERLRRAKYKLEIDFCTEICGEQNGINCNVAQTGNASSEILSFTTKFEPSLARNFFPCWDEPSTKATFNVTVKHAAHLVVLSNMPGVDENAIDRLRRAERIRSQGMTTVTTTVFQETPPMSTYLLAFAVGEYRPLETRTHRNVPLIVWTAREDYLAARFAANFSPTMLDRHEEELEVLYPLPKMDFVAAHSFPVGAMENWGLVVFETQTILMDPTMEENVNMTVDRLYNEYRIEKIVTHELAHQWFGNLVTMRDWSEIWLNEGFATYFVFDFLREDHPLLTEHEYYTRLAELTRKQTGPEHPALVRPMTTEGEVEQAFHTTHLYTKGCVIVRMIRDLVFEDDFKSGVRRYLKKNAYGSVGREELWASMPAYADHGAENERLADVLEPWLVNEGMPEVVISRSYDNYMIRVTQRRAKHHRYKVFLKDDRHKDEAFSSRLRRHLDDDEVKMRTKRSQDGTIFNDDLFEDLPRHYMAEMRKAKKNGRKRKMTPTKAQNIRPSPSILIEQRREELRKTRKVREPSDLWTIPFSYMFGSIKSTEGQVVRQFWLHNRTVSFADVELSPSQALLANPDWTYPFRVNYDIANWKMLARLLHQNHLEIPSKSRMQIIVDSEFYLSQSNSPHLYVYILGYLNQETELGVALMGLDAVYRLVDAFRGTSISSSLLLYLNPVVAQFDRLLDDSQAEPELAALWLIEPTRLSKLYQLRCATNLPTCEQDVQTQRWMQHPSSLQDDVHRQVTAVCHYLFTSGDQKEVQLVSQQLRVGGTQWSISVQLAACVRDSELARTAAKQIVATKNAAVYASSLQSDFSLHHNQMFRSALWTHIGLLPLKERVLLFSANTTAPQPASKILLHSVRTVDELKQVRSLIPNWGGLMEKHIEYLERQLQWQESVANGILKEFFFSDATI